MSHHQPNDADLLLAERQVCCDPPRPVPGAARPQVARRVGEGRGQANGVGKIAQQAGSGMADHPRAVGRFATR
ncbi:hypothetical protein SLV14_007012 [Streptomyces sp. Je 1-4]|uniref:hypothetical protein n=1 Tax=Streptomyces TaxID=1883 RepID=UPI00140EBB53|nr:MULTISPECIES: hypothetical protein [unclassified Streptomyces]QIK10200.1 hypothetical protein G7Z12_33220 [Streptomyces sp. ID38640]UYB45120.1 hypothetical protein SLV14_007012 [Streptomyces sp. Je 1-4]UZQ40393.1 hypothetical protein SLV14N_007012 [Streptomyces sp. Je 1-4] [Streptomyces sp. Je 1-4 4N24]UZQ47810.1 hypothetical protein SLV14NA_007012 [Streptomyces sp. Je 1-4] [Streptomyces sp. Je 1-4 4N24_ara]